MQLVTSPGFRIASHIVFWALSVLFMVMFFGHQQKEYVYTLYFVATLLPVTMTATYLILYYLVPRFLVMKRYAGFFSRVAFILLVSIYLGTMAIFMMLFRFMYGDGPRMDPSTVDIYFLAVGMFSVILLAVAIKIFKLWYEKQKAESRLEREKLQAELNMLKSQIHPHFLFNTLNNIYSLSLQKSDSAPEMLVKLSEILQYILYECNVPFVPIEKEITLLKNYIDLEQIRYGERLDLKWEVMEAATPMEIAPMILLPFVENAFKHGASHRRDKAVISISLALNDGGLEFSVENDKPVTKTVGTKGEKHGLGLVNVRQRLDLIYPGRYRLEIDDTAERYTVHLSIWPGQGKLNEQP